MTLTKAQLVETISEQNGYSIKRSIEIFDGLIEIIKKSLESGEDVLISGFGKFRFKSKSERRGRNFATGSEMMPAARKIVTFKCSSRLKDKINI